MSENIDDQRPFSNLLVSAHAPAVRDDQRLNIAATDADFRQESIDFIVAYIEKARQYPRVQQINMHFAPKRWLDPSQRAGREGSYELLIDGIRQVGAHCEKHALELVLENNNAYWSDIQATPYDKVDWSARDVYFGMSPEEWIQVILDVDRPNVRLCLDSSHTCTYAQMFPPDEREERVLAFLQRPDLIRHVHWNDNYLFDDRGKLDSHAVLNKGTLPTELHRGIKNLPDATLHLEHFYTIEELEQELEFINGL